MYNIDGTNLSSSEVVNIAPGEGQIPVSFTSEPNWEVLAFPKDYSTQRNQYIQERQITIAHSKYLYTRLKYCDEIFAANPQYIFHALEWIEINPVASSIYFAETKRSQSKIDVS